MSKISTEQLQIVREDIFKTTGRRYRLPDLASPDWCIKEAARLGYATIIIYVTKTEAAHYLNHLRKEDVLTYLRKEDITQAQQGNFYIFQLAGPGFVRGKLQKSLLCSTLQEAALLALYKVVLLHSGMAPR